MRPLVLLAVLALAGLLFWWGKRTPRAQVIRTLRRAGLWLGGGLLVGLAATGRLPSLFALLGAALPFLERLVQLRLLWPLAQRLLAGWRTQGPSPGPDPGQASSVRTEFLHVALDHATGTLSGEVLAGRHRGCRLADLTLGELLALREECRPDPPSLDLLETYLDRERGPDWRTGAGPREAAAGSMSRAEALRVLGLGPDAGPAEVIEAHRRLMQRLHPDRGGSDYLAAQINLAKETLLGP